MLGEKVDIKQIKELIQLFEKSKVHKLSFKERHGIEIALEKAPPPPIEAKTQLHHIKQDPHHPVKHVAELPKVKQQAQCEHEGSSIKSPMVGTFYLAPTPDDEPFVKEGCEVEKGDTLCIIEAMKVMNEIKSDVKGKIKKILVNDGDPVEHGHHLFIIE